MEIKPYVLEPGAATSVASGVGGLQNLFKAESHHTGGALSVITAIVRPGEGPPLHMHSREDEAFFVLDGEATFRLGEENFDVGAGSFVFAPRGFPHSFTATSAEMTMLTIIAPGGAEAFFHDLEDAGPDAIPELAQKYGVDILGPNPW